MVESVQDFRKLNKMAIGVKACTSGAVAKHRASNNLPLSARSSYTGPPPKVIPSDVVPAFTYGKATRPSTPIASVVSYQFSAEYEQALEENYQQYDEEKRAVSMRRPKTTKATEGHKEAERKARAQDVVAKEPF